MVDKITVKCIWIMGTFKDDLPVLFTVKTCSWGLSIRQGFPLFQFLSVPPPLLTSSKLEIFSTFSLICDFVVQ